MHLNQNQMNVCLYNHFGVSKLVFEQCIDSKLPSSELVLMNKCSNTMLHSHHNTGFEMIYQNIICKITFMFR